MRTSLSTIALTFAVLLLRTDVVAQAAKRVEYIVDSVARVNQGELRLLGGSVWTLSQPSLALVADDIVIVIEAANPPERPAAIGTAYISGYEVNVVHAAGRYAASTGYLTKVVNANQDGSLLLLADGSRLSVPTYDRYDTSYWLPPYPALLTASRLYLYNLKEGKRIWVKPLG
jgi:hypothetical protein